MLPGSALPMRNWKHFLRKPAHGSKNTGIWPASKKQPLLKGIQQLFIVRRGVFCPSTETSKEVESRPFKSLYTIPKDKEENSVKFQEFWELYDAVEATQE